MKIKLKNLKQLIREVISDNSEYITLIRYEIENGSFFSQNRKCPNDLPSPYILPYSDMKIEFWFTEQGILRHQELIQCLSQNRNVKRIERQFLLPAEVFDESKNNAFRAIVEPGRLLAYRDNDQIAFLVSKD